MLQTLLVTLEWYPSISWDVLKGLQAGQVDRNTKCLYAQGSGNNTMTVLHSPLPPNQLLPGMGQTPGRELCSTDNCILVQPEKPSATKTVVVTEQRISHAGSSLRGAPLSAQEVPRKVSVQSQQIQARKVFEAHTVFVLGQWAGAAPTYWGKLQM